MIKVTQREADVLQAYGSLIHNANIVGLETDVERYSEAFKKEWEELEKKYSFQREDVSGIDPETLEVVFKNKDKLETNEVK